MRFSGPFIRPISRPKLDLLVQSDKGHIFRIPGFIKILQGREFSSADDLSKYTFWQARYSSPEQKGPFDWFLETNKIYPYIEPHIEETSKRHTGKILSFAELGCGTSQLPLFVYKETRTTLQLILIDFVMEALQHQNALFQNVEPRHKLSSSHFICADVLKLPLKDNCVMIAFDKGTMDALLKDRCEGQSKAKLMMSEIVRILDVGGRFIQVSDEDPDSRLLLLENLLVTGTKNSSHSQTQSINPSFENVSFHPLNERLKDEFSIREVELNPEDKVQAAVSWSFKTISHESSDKEYFMYWCDKS